MPAIARVLPWFRQITGETVNSLIDAVNNLTGFGTPQAVSSSGEVFALSALTTNGAISPTTPANYVITKAGVLADTLAAPTSDGIVIKITSATANAHTITATGLLQTGAGANVNQAALAAQPGAGITLMSYQAKWYVIGSVGTVTYS